jgi:hypothetical protein
VNGQVIDEQGNPQTWVAVYRHYRVRYEEECESLDEALAFLWVGVDDGRLSPVEVRGPDGRVVVPEAEIHDATEEWGWAQERREATLRAITERSAGGDR